MKFDLTKIDLAKINPMKFIRNLSSVPENLKTNNKTPANPENPEIAKVQKNIYMQAGLALLTIVLTAVILFAMTSAWYTNIVNTSGLMFEVEAWGFGGEIIVNETPIKAGPGDSGIIHLEVLHEARTTEEEEENGDEVSAILDEAESYAEISTDIIDVKVSITKEKMLEDTKKRIFFYVDSSATVNGEQVEKIYINGAEDYTYTLFGKNDLTITENVSNAPELKWEWVYDVLGYYVLGTGTETNGQVKSISNPEYLRPIEYDLDKATFERSGEGANVSYNLITVDGTTTAAEFLNSVFAADGYVPSEGEKGTYFDIEGKELAETGVYYPVKVNPETGYGVYAYLCTFGEIEQHTNYDTKLGKMAYELENGATMTEEYKKNYGLSFEASINVTAQERKTEAAEVGSYADIKNAIEDGTKAVKLTDDITVGADVYINLSGKEMMIDLNGHTISGEGRYVLRADNGTVTIVNGTIKGAKVEGKKSYAVYVYGESVFNASGITLSGADYGFCICDDTVSKIVDCTISADQSSLLVFGNDSSDEDKKLQIVVENSTFTSGVIGIMGNGSSGSWGTEIVVMNSTITGGSAAVYNPQNYSSMTIYGSNLSGKTGIAVKGGSINIINSKVNGTGESNLDEPSFVGSGFSDTGDAVYIETGLGYDINVRIENSTLTSKTKKSIRVFDEKPNAKVEIISGTFSPAVENENWFVKNRSAGSDE